MELHQYVGLFLLAASVVTGVVLHFTGHLTLAWIIGLVITAVIGLALLGAGVCLDLFDGLF